MADISSVCASGRLADLSPSGAQLLINTNFFVCCFSLLCFETGSCCIALAGIKPMTPLLHTSSGGVKDMHLTACTSQNAPHSHAPQSHAPQSHTPHSHAPHSHAPHSMPLTAVHPWKKKMKGEEKKKMSDRKMKETDRPPHICSGL